MRSMRSKTPQVCKLARTYVTKYFMKYGACRNPRDGKGECKIAGMAGMQNKNLKKKKKSYLGAKFYACHLGGKWGNLYSLNF